MKSSLFAARFIALFCCGLAHVACSSDSGSSVSAQPFGSAAGAGLYGTGGASSGITLVIPEPGSSVGGGLTSDSACAASQTLAELTPVNIVFIYDRSGSMGDRSSGFDPSLRWDPVNAGMSAFFSDPGSHGLSASLKFFPVDGDLAGACAGPYDSPDVPLTPLVGNSPLQAVLAATTPHGGTPTLPALSGAIKYATQLQKDRPEERTVVVLVTDGEPGFLIDGQFVPGCADNDVAHVVAAAQAAHSQSPPLQTYVIGIGPQLDALNAIATAGGTEKAMLVSAGNPGQTASEIQSALGSIRSLQLSCDIAIPAPPNGASLDVNEVNVRLSTSSGGDRVLAYDEACTNGVGWYYDNRAAPKKVELCPATCAEGQGDAGAQLGLLFGCMTIVVR